MPHGFVRWSPREVDLVRPIELVLGRLEDVHVGDGGNMAHCPCPGHGRGRGDRNRSLDVKEGEDGRVLMHCFAGCETADVVAALGLSMTDLFERRDPVGGGGTRHSSGTGSTGQPATIENYANYVDLPVEFLEGLGLEEIRYCGRPAVRMPYFDESGERVLSTRYRVSLTGKPKVKTRKGDKNHLYGLWKLEEARAAGYVWMVEGESDTQTLWRHREPCVGIPGANGFKSEWGAELAGIARIYFVVEDEAGEGCWRKLAAIPELRERLFRVDLRGAKDVSELHKQDPEGFKERLREAREDARAWLDIAEGEQEERSREAWATCRELAESEDILAEFVAELERCRLVGEDTNAKVLFLGLTSRLLPKIVSVVVKGPSSGGKSFLVKTVMRFFPESAFCSFTAMSERTLVYTEESLEHRFVVLYEAAGLGGDLQEYIIRSLLSEGRIDYETVEKTPEGMRPRRIRKEGPTGFVTTTTRHRLHAENETRYLSLTVKDTPEQTRRVLRAIAEEPAEERDLGRWHALQTWLEGAEHGIFVPYAVALAEATGDFAVRLRRDFSALLSLVKAHAILHQASRERDDEGRVVATLEDYARVRELVADLFAEGVEATVPGIIRETVEAVGELVEESGKRGYTTNKALAERLGIDKAAASRRVTKALGLYYLHNLEERRGRPAQLVLGEAMPEDREVLPTPEELEKAMSGCAVDPALGEIEHPPPPVSFGPTPEQDAGGGESTHETASTDQPRDDWGVA